MKAGAFDFIEKPFSDQTLLDRIRRAITIDEEAHRQSEQRGEIRRRYGQLTVREREVMQLVVRGRSNKLIAGDLGLSTKTIEAHRSHVMHKMGATSLAELIRLSLTLDGSEVE